MSLVLITVFLVAGCSGVLSRYGRFSGVDYVAPLGHPAADRLMWSRTDPTLILVNGSEVGFGFQLSSTVSILDRRTGQTQLVASTDNESISAPTWSPDGQQVVLEIPRAARGYEKYEGLWIWNSKTGSMKYLAPRGLALWSPDGTQIAVIESSKSIAGGTLRLVDLNSGAEHIQDIGPTDVVGYVADGDWSPDGRRLVLSIGNSSASIPNNLYTYEVSSRHLLRITNAGGTLPVWSPDGDKIAYIRHFPETGKDSLHILSLRDRCDMDVPQIDRILSASWSPDGKELAFVGPDGIYIMDLSRFMGKYGGRNSCLQF